MKHPLQCASLKWELQMLSVLLETFYLGRINKLQLIFWDGLVIYSWSRMIWLTSMKLLHLGRQFSIYFQFQRKYYPLDKILDQKLEHSGSHLCRCYGAWLFAGLLTQIYSSFHFPNMVVIIHRISPWALEGLLLLGEHESYNCTKSIHLVCSPQVPAPVSFVWFRPGKLFFSKLWPVVNLCKLGNKDSG